MKFLPHERIFQEALAKVASQFLPPDLVPAMAVASLKRRGRSLTAAISEEEPRGQSLTATISSEKISRMSASEFLPPEPCAASSPWLTQLFDAFNSPGWCRLRHSADAADREIAIGLFQWTAHADGVPLDTLAAFRLTSQRTTNDPHRACLDHKYAKRALKRQRMTNM